MKIRSSLIEEQKLILQVVDQPITVNNMIAARTLEIERGWIRPGFNTLILVCTQSVEISPSELHSYVEWAKQNLSALEGSKTAILVDSPHPAAISQLLIDGTSAIRDMRTFSTLRSAALWLQVSESTVLRALPEAKRFDRQ